MALPLALSGCLLALAGAALVLRSRAELGPAWSFVPKADQGTGLVTTGPYRLVRHPIYLGLALLAMGEALAFSSWPALMIVLSGIVPTFAWRARAEEKLLSRTFGERYAALPTANQDDHPVPSLSSGAAAREKPTCRRLRSERQSAVVDWARLGHSRWQPQTEG